MIQEYNVTFFGSLHLLSLIQYLLRAPTTLLGTEDVTVNKMEIILTCIKRYSSEKDRLQINRRVILKVSSCGKCRAGKKVRLCVGEGGSDDGITRDRVAGKASLSGNI